jgi:hypothetical protein
MITIMSRGVASMAVHTSSSDVTTNANSGSSTNSMSVGRMTMDIVSNDEPGCWAIPNRRAVRANSRGVVALGDEVMRICATMVDIVSD